MGFFGDLFSSVRDIVSDAVDKARDVIGDACGAITDFFSEMEGIDEGSVESQVDVDAALSDFRKEIEEDINNIEKQCMKLLSELFDELTKNTVNIFPDLVEIVRDEQKKAEKELKGTTMRYIQEKLSKNDTNFLQILKMKPGKEKADKLNKFSEKVFEQAEKNLHLNSEGIQRRF